MIRHPRYLEIPWDVHWHQEETGTHRHAWELILALIFLVTFLIAVAVTTGIM
jgi:hypothetical protein